MRSGSEFARRLSRETQRAPRFARGETSPSRPPDPLPPELAFLPAHGVTLDLLLRALQQARAENSHPVEVMLAEGWIGADFYYACLARHCGAAFIDSGASLVGGALFPHAIRAGMAEIVPMAGARWLAAPRGRAIAPLIALARRVQHGPPPFALTTPQRLSLLVQARARRDMAAQASFDLRDLDPALSAHRRPQARRAGSGALRWGAAALLAAAVLTPFGAIAISALFALALAVRLAAVVAAPASASMAPALPDHQLPSYSILVPLYREARVVAGLIAALERLDYPKSLLDVHLLVEEGDRSTRAALEALHLPPYAQVLACPNGRPRTKPRALNFALPLARGRLLVVYDAEDRPQPQQLRAAAAQFARSPPRVACLQASLAIENVGDSWLTRLFAIEYAALFDVLNPGLASLDLPLPLGGTSNHFKTDVLRRCGGWDAWNVTEDADLGLRLARFGYRVATLGATTFEEAPARLNAWLGQRRRWQKGWLQTLIVLARDPLRVIGELGPARALAAAGLVLGMVMGPLFGPAFAAWMVWQSLYGELLAPQGMLAMIASTLACFVFLAGILCALLPAVLGVRRRRLWRCAPWLLALPAYHVFMSLAAWQAVGELFSRPFHWQKTAHGLAKTSAR